MRIGISGISTSGKTTLANALVKHFNCGYCCADKYYNRDQSSFPRIPFLGDMIAEWDSPQCIFWDKFENQVESMQDDLIILESFLLFYSKKVGDTIDGLIALEYEEIDLPIALARRVKRVTGEEVPKDYKENPKKSEAHWESNYFEQIAWPYALKNPEYREPKDYKKPVLRLKATAPLEDNITAAINFINELRAKTESS
ncbi:hypothetical protein TVAG_262370 [Trichomonas vaginalis G3]|uniref:Uncharacterized protein n=1 Tax=Trichomonas vaginalis (strain ATCC PRA-98 / G3) TaxID=412133 RepID=A2DUE9_TRIV3|nr:AAA domain-containing protein [Trichomonas vaginalis G3]EAY15987.1 hypothetical protein TVAG_262370 [Trichomonas vaginalis G3]KAI5523622.1 AAA domain-containing protein [Trichomonas vaginalis G3]|eukprot:XP_001328210.1 hypothetical protein [Trichomonas vaginalis G3]